MKMWMMWMMMMNEELMKEELMMKMMWMMMMMWQKQVWKEDNMNLELEEGLRGSLAFQEVRKGRENPLQEKKKG